VQDKFHSNDCYPIGPYGSIKEYVLACYDKEIYYYTHAAASDIDESFFESTPLPKFVHSLEETRKSISNEMSQPDEPFVLVHGDFHGRNIIMNCTEVSAVLDWEFAGSYPLSELLDDNGISVLECEDTHSADENMEWCDRILECVGDVARRRGWKEEDVDLLVNGRNEALQLARGEMFPID
jgi:hypothetical protein